MLQLECKQRPQIDAIHCVIIVFMPIVVDVVIGVVVRCVVVEFEITRIDGRRKLQAKRNTKYEMNRYERYKGEQ